MITVIAKPQPCVGIKGTETTARRAYRLVHDSLAQNSTDDIYIRSFGNEMLNLSKLGYRRPNPEDRYVEVDLDIIVKEKS